MSKKIVIDVLGGDNAPDAVLDGVVLAATKNPQLEFLLVGDETVIKARMAQAGLSARIKVIHTTEKIGADEPPAAFKTKPNSSIALAVDALRTREDVGAFVSAGSTGAVLAASILKLGRIAGVSRPGLCPIFRNNQGGHTMLIDVGANADCRPEQLVHFAIMGSELMRSRGVVSPRVALLNIGTEETKGNELAAAAYKLLQKTDLNFVGNMEARDVFSGNQEVIVCDGFSGNIVLKSYEGAMIHFGAKLKGVLKTSLRAKIGALFLKNKLRQLKKEFNYGEEFGGVILLGAKKPVVKAHGNATAMAFCNAITLASSACVAELGIKITQALERNKLLDVSEK